MENKEQKEILGLLGANVQANELHFILTVNSGKVRQFLLSPLHAKRLLVILSANVGAYEKQFGEIAEPSAENLKSTEGTKIGFQSESE